MISNWLFIIIFSCNATITIGKHIVPNTRERYKNYFKKKNCLLGMRSRDAAVGVWLQQSNLPLIDTHFFVLEHTNSQGFVSLLFWKFVCRLFTECATYMNTTFTTMGSPNNLQMELSPFLNFYFLTLTVTGATQRSKTATQRNKRKIRQHAWIQHSTTHKRTSSSNNCLVRPNYAHKDGQLDRNM
jgi:hypothetical protein